MSRQPLLTIWSIGTSPDAELVKSMLDSAISTLNPGEQPILGELY
jgi:hypothetical protein